MAQVRPLEGWKEVERVNRRFGCERCRKFREPLTGSLYIKPINPGDTSEYKLYREQAICDECARS